VAPAPEGFLNAAWARDRQGWTDGLRHDRPSRRTSDPVLAVVLLKPGLDQPPDVAPATCSPVVSIGQQEPALQLLARAGSRKLRRPLRGRSRSPATPSAL
jgi:hypothetical protein